MNIRNAIGTAALFVAGLSIARVAAAQDVYTRTDVREAFERVERHGDEFKKAFHGLMEHVTLPDKEKHLRDSVDDLESVTDNLKKDYKDKHYDQARQDLDTAMTLASSINRFMLRNYVTAEASRAWVNLKADLNVIALGYGVPPLPNLLPATLAPVPGAAVRTGDSADRMERAEIFQNRLQREVRHELVMLPYYGVFDNLGYRIEGNTVILIGQVTRPTLKSDAEAAVKNIEGVDRVVNNIDVLPLSSNDDRIRLAVYRAIYGYPALQRYELQAVPPIHIIVNNGHVALEGVVANETDRNLAYMQAQGVPGVFSVTNHLRLD